LTTEQKMIVDRQLQVSNYVYNKTVHEINNSHSIRISKLTLRDKLVTENTRKSNLLLSKVNSAKTRIESIINDLKKSRNLRMVVKAVIIKKRLWSIIKLWYDYLRNIITPTHNVNLKDFEVAIHKDIRAGSVFEACTNFTNCVKAVNSGRIRHFRLQYRSKKKKLISMILPSNMVKIENGILRFTNKNMIDKRIRVNRRTHHKLSIVSKLRDCRLTKKFGYYKLHIPIDISHKVSIFKRVVGIDPGVSMFLSGYSPERTFTIQQSNESKRLDSLRKKLKYLRNHHERKRLRRKLLSKFDIRKSNIVDELHWKSIRYILHHYDLIFLEKFDSQGFVKNGKNRGLNRNTNNLKPFQFRQRLLYKAGIIGKIVNVVSAYNTTKSCSNCGNIRKMTLSDRIYTCKNCDNVYDRDFNAAKNILMKGWLV